MVLLPAAGRWKDTGNRMRAKEAGGWWTGYVLLVNTHRWLNEAVTNRFSWWHHLTLIVSKQRMRFSQIQIVFGKPKEAGGWWTDGVCAAGEHPPLAQPVRHQPILLVASFTLIVS
ncbi:unnamed protein product [Closterium sp. Yama58-4]|nr:unnamed protein product [Closterium sp. Yama58-4]